MYLSTTKRNAKRRLVDRDAGSSAFAQLAELFAGGERLEDVDFLPGPKEDVPAVTVVEHHLGIGMWVVPSLFVVAKKCLQTAATAATARQAPNSAQPEPPTPAPSIDLCSMIVLMIASDSNTVWNLRKSLLQSQLPRPGRRCSRRRATAAGVGAAGGGACQCFSRELYINTLVLTKNPKSAETWSHRGWVLRQVERDLAAAERGARSPATRWSARTMAHRALLVAEFAVCQRAAEQYRRCYYAWVHRLQVAKMLQQRGCTRELHDDFDGLKQWLATNVTDSSAMHYLSQLQRWLWCPESGQSVEEDRQVSMHVGAGAAKATAVPSVLGRMNAVSNAAFGAAVLSRRYPGHEALWCNRRAQFDLHLHLLRHQSPTPAHVSLHRGQLLDILAMAKREDPVDPSNLVWWRRLRLWQCFQLARTCRDAATNSGADDLRAETAALQEEVDARWRADQGPPLSRDVERLCVKLALGIDARAEKSAASPT